MRHLLVELQHWPYSFASGRLLANGRTHARGSVIACKETSREIITCGAVSSASMGHGVRMAVDGACGVGAAGACGQVIRRRRSLAHGAGDGRLAVGGARIG